MADEEISRVAVRRDVRTTETLIAEWNRGAQGHTTIKAFFIETDGSAPTLLFRKYANGGERTSTWQVRHYEVDEMIAALTNARARWRNRDSDSEPDAALPRFRPTPYMAPRTRGVRR